MQIGMHWEIYLALGTLQMPCLAKRTCLFFIGLNLWKNILEIIIRGDLQDDYRRFCNEYTESKTNDELQAMYVAIWAWWYFDGVALNENIRESND